MESKENRSSTSELLPVVPDQTIVPETEIVSITDMKDDKNLCMGLNSEGADQAMSENRSSTSELLPVVPDQTIVPETEIVSITDMKDDKNLCMGLNSEGADQAMSENRSSTSELLPIVPDQTKVPETEIVSITDMKDDKDLRMKLNSEGVDQAMSENRSSTSELLPVVPDQTIVPETEIVSITDMKDDKNLCMGLNSEGADQAMSADCFGIIVDIEDGVEVGVYAMKSDVFAIGSSKSNDVIIPDAGSHEALLQANRFGEVFLFQQDTCFLKGLYLKHSEVFTVGGKMLKWKYPLESVSVMDPENDPHSGLISGEDPDNDSDYVPDSDSESSSDELSDVLAPLEMLNPADKPENSYVKATVTSTASSENEDDDAKLQESKNSKDKRVWDKIHSCIFCGKHSTNITKHYLGVHKNEEEVKKISCLKKGSKERSLELIRLRNAGDYQHNMDVLRSRKGMLITYTRRKGAGVDDYLPCEDCLGFFMKDSLWRHRKSCPFNTDCQTKYSKIQASAKLMIPSSVVISEGLREKVIKRMVNDEVSICARNDNIIVKIGENLFQRNGHLEHMGTFISQKMRELARFLIVARKENKDIQHLNDIIDPQMFQVAIKATRILCGYNQNTHCFSNPSLALKIGHQLKKCARIKKSECLMNKLAGREDAENFLTLIESEWTNNISSNALQTITEKKMNRSQMLPLTEDIKTLTIHLEESSEKCMSSLSQDFKKSNWETLNKATLTRIVLFNRKRGGEVERLKIENYYARQTSSKPMPEIESTLSQVEQMLCLRFGRVEIRGKKGRTVAVLLTPEMQRCINVLLKHREEAGVNPKNNFVFARASGDSLNPIRMSDTLRTYRSTLKLTAGDSLTSTKLRKHVATVSQVLNLSRLDMEVMADFLGHDIDVHRSFYRLPQSTIQVAKMGKLLTAFNDGTIAKYKGLSLDEISLDEELSSDEETDIDEEADHEEDHEEDHINEVSATLTVTEEAQPSCSVTEKTQPSSFTSHKKHSNPGKGRKIQKLTTEQRQLLHNLFEANISLRRELKMMDCINAINKHKCLNDLSWLKIKNTIHNWIIADKRRLKKL